MTHIKGLVDTADGNREVDPDLLYLEDTEFRPWSGEVDQRISKIDSLYVSLTGIQSISGEKTFQDPILFNTNPTTGSFVEGKLYYDKKFKTLALNMDGDVTLQIGQEEVRYVFNNTGAPIPNGSAVYTNGVHTGIGEDPSVATVALAIATNYSTAWVLGIATNDIDDQSYGFICVRGHANDLDTSDPTWNIGQPLYLSSSVPGGLTNVLPLDPALHVRVGRLIVKHGNIGTINVRVEVSSRLQDLSDASTSSPTDGDIVIREGNTWVYKPAPVSAGTGVSIFLDNIPNDGGYKTVTRTPDITTLQQTVSASIPGNSTEFIAGFIYPPPQNRTKLDGGIWQFNNYVYVDATPGITTLIVSTFRVTYPGGIVSIPAGNGNVTIAISGYSETPFTSGDANSDITLAGYLQTADETFQITEYNNDHQVTIFRPTGYAGETNVAYSVHKHLFKAETSEINQTDTPTLSPAVVAQPDLIYPFLTDTTAFRYYGRTDHSVAKIISMTFNGITNYSWIQTPVSIRHNELAGLNSGDYQHLTWSQFKTAITGTVQVPTSIYIEYTGNVNTSLTNNNNAHSGFLTHFQFDTYSGNINIDQHIQDLAITGLRSDVNILSSNVQDISGVFSTADDLEIIYNPAGNIYTPITGNISGHFAGINNYLSNIINGQHVQDLAITGKMLRSDFNTYSGLVNVAQHTQDLSITGKVSTVTYTVGQHIQDLAITGKMLRSDFNTYSGLVNVAQHTQDLAITGKVSTSTYTVGQHTQDLDITGLIADVISVSTNLSGTFETGDILEITYNPSGNVYTPVTTNISGHFSGINNYLNNINNGQHIQDLAITGKVSTSTYTAGQHTQDLAITGKMLRSDFNTYSGLVNIAQHVQDLSITGKVSTVTYIVDQHTQDLAITGKLIRSDFNTYSGLVNIAQHVQDLSITGAVSNSTKIPGTTAKNYNSDGTLGDRNFNGGYIYECITTGTGGSGRWIRYVAETSSF